MQNKNLEDQVADGNLSITALKKTLIFSEDELKRLRQDQGITRTFIIQKWLKFGGGGGGG